MTKRLLLFGMNRLSEAVAKGNLSYLRHYERYFDEVYVVYLYGDLEEPIKMGKTTCISVGRGSPLSDLLLAPIRLLRLARQLHVTSFLTADIVFSWWTSALLRIVLGAPVVLMPVCIPDEIYRSTGRSLSGAPIFLERCALRLSYWAATRIVTSQNGAAQVAWLRADWQTAGKLAVLPATPEEFPPATVFDALFSYERRSDELNEPARLLYVGRLHHEKLCADLVPLMHELKKRGVDAKMVVAGDGPEFESMVSTSRELEVSDRFEWLGFVGAEDLPKIYIGSDIFVSTVTGTALREAAFAGLPVVGYNTDWVKVLLKHEETALLVPPHKPEELALQIERVLRDADLRHRIATAFRDKARQMWNLNSIAQGLHEMFDAAGAA